MNDMVNSPLHYQSGLDIEVADIIEEFYPDNGRMWNVLKYILRAKKKGKYIEDLKKARWYLEREIKQYERRDEGTNPI